MKVSYYNKHYLLYIIYNQIYNLENFSKAFPSFDTFVVVAESLTTDNLEYRILAY